MNPAEIFEKLMVVVVLFLAIFCFLPFLIDLIKMCTGDDDEKRGGYEG